MNMNTDFVDNEALRSEFLSKNPKQVATMFAAQKECVRRTTLKEFAQTYIYDFDAEAQREGWHATDLQEVFEDVWDKHPNSMTKVPRGFLKTSTVLIYLLKQIFIRQYPIEISYYHHSIDMAIEKLRKLRKNIQDNPILYYGLELDDALSLKNDLIVLKDGTVIQPLSWKQGTVGKHPHIIVLDDVIDKSVIYSDEQNKKAIEKFYIDILPMIGKESTVKKIIGIGTAQRKDDLYESLPNNFYRLTLPAILNESRKQVLSPDLYTWDDLMKVKENILSNPQEGGERFWLKEYMNIPFDRLGTIVSSNQIRYYHSLPPDLQLYQGWDLSVAKDMEKSDYTVGVMIGIHTEPDGKMQIYIIDRWRGRWQFAERLNQVKDFYTKYRVWTPGAEFYLNARPFAIGIESVAFQYDTIQTLMQTTLLPIIEVKAIKNKIESFQTELGPYFERFQVLLPENAPWIREYTDELLALPTGSYDDQADGTKIAIKTALYQPIGGVVTIAPKAHVSLVSGVRERVF